MRKLILTWLFGTDDIEDYFKVLRDNINYCKIRMDDIQYHLKTLEEHKKALDIIMKLIKVCENHGIDVDEEIKHVEL